MKFVCAVVSVIICFCQVTIGSYVEEEKIFTKLLTDYKAQVKPSQTTRSPVNVDFDVKLKSINTLSIKNQNLAVDVFIIMAWSDPCLAWNKTLYNDTNRINFDGTSIWTPDILLLNRADPEAKKHTSTYISKVLVFNTGRCIWRNVITLSVSCNLDITWFPVDKQTCAMNFGSWSYSKSQLALRFLSKPTKKDHLKAGHFQVDSGEWEIIDFGANATDLKFDCCPELFSVIEYKLIMSRVSLYYFMYILLPLISLAFLFLLVFHIPPDSGERMGFGVTILLSITVYLLVISEKLPEKSDDTPMLGICFITIFYILIIALSMAACTTIFSRHTSKPPDWLLNLTTKGCFRLKEDDLNVRKITPVHSKKSSTEGGHDKNGNLTAHYHVEEVLPTETSEDRNYNDDWIQICRAIDKKLFIIYCALMVIVPVIITLSLPTTGMA